MEWVKAIFAIIFFVAVYSTLLAESITVVDNKAVIVSEQKITLTYDQLLAEKKRLENVIAASTETITQIDGLLAQMTPPEVVVNEQPKVVNPLVIE